MKHNGLNPSPAKPEKRCLKMECEKTKAESCFAITKERRINGLKGGDL